MKNLNMEYTEEDIEIIKRQLNIDDIRLTGVTERCKWGYPSIIILHPFRKPERGEPDTKRLNHASISSPIWLTCPYLNGKIHKLESDGFIKKIGVLMHSSREYIESMKFAHAHYFFLRKDIYRHFLGDISSMEENMDLFNAGIGGAGNTDALKCLHLHYTHFRLCDWNFAGRATSMLLNDDKFCDDCRCGGLI
jgi:hypothetical protein